MSVKDKSEPGNKPQRMTTACSKYLEENVAFFKLVATYERLWSNLLNRAIVRREIELERARELLRRGDIQESEVEQLERTAAIPEERHIDITRGRFSELLWETAFCRAVDNFLTYVSDLLGIIFSSRPETLRGRETVTVEDVLEHESLEEFIHELAEKKVHELSYKGLDELNNDLTKRLKFPLFKNEDHLTRARSIVEMRNLITHNRGVVNKIFLKRLPQYPKKVGERLSIDAEFIAGAVSLLTEVVMDMDRRAAEKFILACPVEISSLADKMEVDAFEKYLDSLFR